VSEFRFADPQWVHALWGVLGFVALLLWLDRRSGSALGRVVAEALQHRLVKGPSGWRRRLGIALLGLAGACLVVALMRPQWGLRHVPTQRVGAEIMVCLDVSRSMLAEDVAPNRLERAKAEIADLLGYFQGDQIGLIAFAGRASVLAPLTPDFSFLRLVLDGVGVHSVTRGGTRLEAPIRQAVEGFGPPGEVSRAILLITDGEDHDSFPLDAAAEAAELGIAIIAIGFGDEDGSEVYVTDPRSGARSLLRDGDGRSVRSRLDGELLRELASATGGAYVPAGTGVLDLESIYERHLARLTRGRLDPRGRAVRDEAYQWAVLLALVFLLAGVTVTQGGAASAAGRRAQRGVAERSPRSAERRSNGRAGGERSPRSAERRPNGRAEGERSLLTAGLLLAIALTPSLARGDQEAAPGPGQQTPEAPAASEELAEPEDPRVVYNLGVEALDEGEFEEAEGRFQKARREARGDGELRSRTAYNLGWAAVARAEALEQGAPADALRALHEGAAWFREAVGQRPDDTDARQNLDVTLRRALLLADQLAQQDPRDAQGRLEELAARQRALVAGTATLLEQLAATPDAAAADRFRGEFQGQAAQQRTLLSDADQLAAELAEEQAALEARSEDERAPEDQMRTVQLAHVLHYLHRARERMGQARRQLRQQQGDRAYRRASAALMELKRALDPLRDPVAVLDVLLRDASEIAASTAVLAASRSELPGLGERVRVPPWLTLESLREDQAAVAERTGELGLRLRAGLAQVSGAEADPRAAEQLQALREAEPFVATGEQQLERATRELEAERPEAALSEQRAGIAALAEARERFFGLRRLIEATYADQKRIQTVLSAEGDAAETARGEYLPSLRAAQAKNLERGERLEDRIRAEGERLAAAPPDAGPQGGAPDPEALAAERERAFAAGQILTSALAAMDDVARGLGGEEVSASAVDWSQAREAGERAVARLESLRRLFFSVVEQVRELAQRQLDLADETQDAVALSAAGDEDLPQRVASLVPRQGQLAEGAGEIANALVEQSDRAGGVVAEEEDPAETSRRLRLAGERVLAAQGEMEEAAAKLEAEPPELGVTRERQDAALVALQEALALLEPPDQQKGDDAQQQPGDDGEGQGEQDAPQPSAAAAMDPAQLLQAVRDREAQRRRERDARQRAGYETVEKDW
jgi:Ca-activated chloride channel family protein